MGQNLVAVVNGGYIYTSPDSGATWSERASAGSRAWSGVASSSDGQHLVAVVNGGYIYTSSDFGVSWSPRTSVGSRAWSAVASSAKEWTAPYGYQLVATVDGGYIYTSSDSGATWSERTTAGSRSWSAVASTPSGYKMVAVASGDSIWSASDYGNSWTELTGAGGRAWTAVASSQYGERLVAAVNDGYLYTSENYGSTWYLHAGGPADVDKVVDLGDATSHPSHVAAGPYNYSDMTGFNNHVVNPDGCPLKGYWTVIDDAGSRVLWHDVSWDESLETGDSIEVYVRASDDRVLLSNEPFLRVSNSEDISGNGIRGQFLEVRVGFVRADCDGNPVLSYLTVNGTSSSIRVYLPLEDQTITEGSDGAFEVAAIGGELSYEWHFEGGYEWLPLVPSGALGPVLPLPAVDCLDEGYYSVVISDVSGDQVDGGVGFLAVQRRPITIPAVGSSGAASPYPAQITVPEIDLTDGKYVSRITATISGLTHSRPSNLDILLVSPFGQNVWLMSDAGTDTEVTDITIIFDSDSDDVPPLEGLEPLTTYEGATLTYRASNHGTQESSLPGVPTSGTYSTSLDALIGQGRDPQGPWQLYIYDDSNGGVGYIQGSWCLDFTISQ